MSDFSCFCMFYRYWRAFLYPILWLLPSKIFWDDQIFLWWWYGQSFSCISLILRWVVVYFLLLTSMNLQPIFIEKNSSPFDVDTFKSNFPLNSHLATQMLWQAGLAGFDKALQKICRTLNSCSVSPSTLSFLRCSSGCTCTQEEALLAAQMQAVPLRELPVKGRRWTHRSEQLPVAFSYLRSRKAFFNITAGVFWLCPV